MRINEIKRKTTETDIVLTLNLDGAGWSEISSGCGFFDHMLELFASHAKFDLTVTCKGDVNVDDHHSVEDIGICLGTAFSKAIGTKAGINRFGNMILPMDEALVLCAVDVSGRGQVAYDVQIPCAKVGEFDTELAREFFGAFARNAGVTVHIKQLAGDNSHHILEGCFKAFARALREAVYIRDNMGAVPSTKGVL